MSRPPASSAGLRLLLCYGTAMLFFVAMFRLGWTVDAPKNNPTKEPNLSDAQIGLKSSTGSDSTAAPSPDPVFVSLVEKLRHHPPSDPVLMTALEQLAQDPAQAVAIARRLMQEFPDQAGEIGTIVIGALLRASAFAPAIELAQNGPEASRTGWITLVLTNWTQSRPEDAELITEQLREKGVNAESFSLVTKSWANAAPASLANYALTLPPGGYRSIAIISVLDPWIQQDPAAVLPWLARLIDPYEKDQTLSRLATHTDNAFRPTSQALAWAESIGDSALRRDTLASVVREWFGQDPTAATHYIDSSPVFDQSQRQQLVASFSPPIDPP